MAPHVQQLAASYHVELWQEAEEDLPSAFEAMKHCHYF
jgi:hypothetical protein